MSSVKQLAVSFEKCKKSSSKMEPGSSKMKPRQFQNETGVVPKWNRGSSKMELSIKVYNKDNIKDCILITHARVRVTKNENFLMNKKGFFCLAIG